MSHLTRPVDRTSDNPAQDPRTWKQIQTLKGREKSPAAKAVVTGSQGHRVHWASSQPPTEPRGSVPTLASLVRFCH